MKAMVEQKIVHPKAGAKKNNKQTTINYITIMLGNL